MFTFCYLFTGGHREFYRRYKDLCEDALVSPTCRITTSKSSHNLNGSSSSLYPTPTSPSGTSTEDIDSHPASRVLPFLYLGNSRDAADLTCLKTLGTTCVLNVTSQLPGYHQSCGITYKQIPASDSGHQNLKQYFEEAFDFIGKYF